MWRSVCQSIRRSPARRQAETRRFFRKLSADSGSLPPLENTSALAEVSLHHTASGGHREPGQQRVRAVSASG